MDNVKKTILILNGSLRANSSTAAIVQKVKELFFKQIKFVSSIIEIPLFNDPINIPESVISFKKSINSAEGILICTPEYAFGVPGALKNILDWTVATGDLVNKKVCLITAATSGQKAHSSMLDILNALSADVDMNATLLISFIRSKIINGEIKDESTVKQIRLVLEYFIESCI